jgi:putative transposase
MPTPNDRNWQKFKKIRRYNDPGHAHSLTFCCFRRRPFLAKHRSCQWLADAVVLARETHEFDLWAYVFMPDYVHMLVCARQTPYDVSNCLATIKQSVTRKAVAHVREHSPAFLARILDKQPNGRRHYRFWQRGPGFDRNTWSDKALLAEIDYIHANPLRCNLCDRPEEWLWSSAADYLHARQGPLKIDLDSLPRFVAPE